AQVGQAVVIGRLQDDVLGYFYSGQWGVIGPLFRPVPGVGRDRLLSRLPLTIAAWGRAVSPIRQPAGSRGARGFPAGRGQPATQGISQCLGDHHVDELSQARAVPVEVDPAVVLRTPGKLEWVLLRAALDQDLLHTADHAFADRPRLCIDSCLQALQPRLLDVHRRVVREGSGGSAGPGTVDEAERLVEAQVFDELHRRVEVRLCFAGET